MNNFPDIFVNLTDDTFPQPSRMWQLNQLLRTIPRGPRLQREVHLLLRHIEVMIMSKSYFEITEDEALAIAGIYHVLRELEK